MRIGIDARFFGPQETGIGRYVERLVSHLEDFDDGHEYVVFLRRPMFDQWTPRRANWSKVLADYRWYTLAEQLFMPGIFRRARLDLLHVPHFNVPVLARTRTIVTIHDLILNQFPTARASTLGPSLYQVKYASYRFVIRQAVRRAAAIITVSEYSRQDLLRRFTIPADRVVVTYEAAEPLAAGVPVEALQARGIRPPYLLTVGNAYPHKNLERYLEASALAVKQGEQFQVVIVGKRDYFSRRLEAIAKERGWRHVSFFGFASEDELAGLYRHAHAYFFPSLSEGFGLPGLEAMQVDLPVYASRASCLPEVFGPAARYFDPNDTDDVVVSIKAALHDTLERRRLIQAGQAQRQRYSWARMTDETHRLYERVYAEAKTNTHRPTPKRP